MTLRLVTVAIPAPLYRNFDYAAGEGMTIAPGARVRVGFGRRQVVGVAIEAPRDAQPDGRTYKEVSEVLDAEPLMPAALLELCQWASGYYQHPLGETIAGALPATLRRGGKTEVKERKNSRKRKTPPADTPPPLTPEQAAALAVLREGAGFSVSLLEGVTGSGKTELYLQRAADVIENGGQVLVLVPEIGLTPQLTDRFARRFGERVASYHSAMADGERARTWLRAKAGEVPVIVGTRSAIFLPLPKLSLVIVDEEHDASFKQQDSLRYSARDLAIVRAQRAGAAVILGSATPSLETLHNAQAGRYRHARLTRRVHEVAPPAIGIIDIRGQALEHGIAAPLMKAIERHAEAGGQSLLFINRRGYAPVLLCHDCGWQLPCRRCDSRLTWHRSRARLMCHHCGFEAMAPARCGDCGSPHLVPLGQGTERIEDALRLALPGKRVERFDSDRVSRRGELESLLEDVHAGKVHVVVGTQMLAKGHDFPLLTLVGILDVDAGLYGSDFRATERMGALITQVAGRAGRTGQRAEVYLQTHQPQHPLLRSLLSGGYTELCASLASQRKALALPPYSHLALLRAESGAMERAIDFLRAARDALGKPAGVEALGPVPAPMEKRGGRYRAQLLLRSASRPALQRALAAAVQVLDALPQARNTRWSVDVDPVDLF